MIESAVASTWVACSMSGLRSNANGVVAALEEPRGVSVAVDCRSVGNIVVAGDVCRDVPAKKFLLDDVAVGVIADGAFALVPAERFSRVGLRPAAFFIRPPTLRSCEMNGLSCFILSGPDGAPTHASITED